MIAKAQILFKEHIVRSPVRNPPGGKPVWLYTGSAPNQLFFLIMNGMKGGMKWMNDSIATV